MDAEQLELAGSFLQQAPPGEINDVLNDVRTIISDDESLQEAIQPALRDYNMVQFTTVQIPGVDHLSIISEAARLESPEGEERYVDPRCKTSFLFDHLSLEASNPEPYEPDPESEPFREALQEATLKYLSAHYYDGIASVFNVSGGPPNRFIIQIVANKYNPTNYWSGRWRSEYEVDLSTNQVNGKSLVHVHYYEQGNVQLNTNNNISISLPPAVVASPPASSASKILALIESEEGKYQASLNDTYHDMGEKTFKSLRRALPMTRSKLDWDRVLGYKIGAELSAGKSIGNT